ncbi:protein-L-isoaspartate(D-aspartate) O-methyltransferase [Paraflavisolibacter sp. H34]|uniref:protein-L-isoaspartate(D-aspartate) O-methyltransferase n=1 Tax=Huijunlia imazamoxiresistens TaxID=3127457 RepID=UPI00301759EE
MKALLFWLLVLVPWPRLPAQDYEKSRLQMVKTQIERRGIRHAPTLQALRQVPRHLFLPPAQLQYAYEDRPLPIGYGQTISQPYIVAFMTETVQPGPGKRVLEVGTGSGYQAAVLAQAGCRVYTIEIVDALANEARKRLQRMNYKNIEVKNGDGYFGWKEQAPFDAIVVTAAAEHIPPPLTEQLKEGGRMIIPIGSPFMTQQLMLVQKTGGRLRTTSLLPVRFVPFTRASDKPLK